MLLIIRTRLYIVDITEQNLSIHLIPNSATDLHQLGYAATPPNKLHLMMVIKQKHVELF